MAIDRIPITNREQWLNLRKADVTASVVGSLFGVHPYVSAYSLYAEKTGDLPEEPMNAFLEWRLILEGAVAAAVERQRPDWKIIKATHYFRDADLHLGATPDFFVEDPKRGLGVLQAKTVAPQVFKNTWTDEAPPFWISLQTATEMMLTEVSWGACAGLVIDPWKLECPIFEIPRHAGVEQRITDAVKQFWRDVMDGNEPQPDYKRDAELIAAMYPAAVPSKTVDLSTDNMLPMLLSERAEAKARMNRDEDRCKEIDAEVKFKMGDAEIATLADFAITHKVINRKGYEVKPSSYRQLRITDHRPKESAHDDGSF